MQTFDQEYMKTFNTMGGADIQCIIGNSKFGELQAITYAVHREIAPMYVCGTAGPVGFGKGKRGISGSLIFLMFDRDALYNTLLTNMKQEAVNGIGYTSTGNVVGVDGKTPLYGANRYSPMAGRGSNGTWNTAVNANDGIGVTGNPVGFSRLNYRNITYLDQFPPFDITISMANEAGATSGYKIFGIQILNEGAGMSVDDLVLEKACSFVARAVQPIGFDKIQAGLGD